jgi:hypothetical protein
VAVAHRPHRRDLSSTSELQTERRFNFQPWGSQLSNRAAPGFDDPQSIRSLGRLCKIHFRKSAERSVHLSILGDPTLCIALLARVSRI